MYVQQQNLEHWNKKDNNKTPHTDQFYLRAMALFVDVQCWAPL